MKAIAYGRIKKPTNKVNAGPHIVLVGNNAEETFELGEVAASLKNLGVHVITRKQKTQNGYQAVLSIPVAPKTVNV